MEASVDRGDEGKHYCNKNKIIGCVATAPLNPETKLKVEKKYSMKLYEGYGLSETLFVSTNYPAHDRSNTVGRKLDGVQLEFYEDNEIGIALPWMFLEYHNQKKLEFMDEEKYLSGDLGNLDNENYLQITGRKKDLILKGGVNISPRRIEDFISIHFKTFDEFAVIGFKNNLLGEKIVCFYVSHPPFTIDQTKKLNLKIIENLGKDYSIDEFVRLEKIPLTENGKTDKPKIRKLYLKKNNLGNDYPKN